MFNRCLADEACEALYAAVGCALFARDRPGLDLDPAGGRHCGAARPLAGAGRRAEQRGEHSPEKLAEEVEDTREFIAGRQVELAAWLGMEPNPGSGATVTAASDRQSSVQTQVGLRIDRMIVREGVLFTRLTVPGAGKIEKRAEIRTAKGAVKACGTRRKVRDAGTVDLRCPLSPGVAKATPFPLGAAQR